LANPVPSPKNKEKVECAREALDKLTKKCGLSPRMYSGRGIKRTDGCATGNEKVSDCEFKERMLKTNLRRQLRVCEI